MEHRINWFEIPATDLDRARKFYGSIFEIELAQMSEYEGIQTAFFPDTEGISGCVVQGSGYAPSREGAVIYLNGNPDLSTVLNRVEAAGGRVEQLKTSIGEHGFVGMFIDTEGNRVGLHSMK